MAVSLGTRQKNIYLTGSIERENQPLRGRFPFLIQTSQVRPNTMRLLAGESAIVYFISMAFCTYREPSADITKR